MFVHKKIKLSAAAMACSAVFLLSGITSPSAAWAKNISTEYSRWNDVGVQAAFKAVSMIRKQFPPFQSSDSIVLTNAGYADVDGESTMGALDGLSSVLKVSRGNHSLLEIHSAANAPLWFAVFDKKSGHCAYLQINSAAGKPLFSREEVEQINAGHLFANPAEYAQKFDAKIFGGNEFRIVTIANAVAAGADTKAARAFEFHDHYCPGVTSGILMARYIEKNFTGGSLFVQSTQPWCKEDALQAILNLTPGKKTYDVLYPAEADLNNWPAWAQAASTIVYRKAPRSDVWTGTALSVSLAGTDETRCPDYGHATIDKLCADLWYLDKMDQPEHFVAVQREFTLPQGVAPTDLARPGVDPVKLIEALQ